MMSSSSRVMQWLLTAKNNPHRGGYGNFVCNGMKRPFMSRTVLPTTTTAAAAATTTGGTMTTTMMMMMRRNMSNTTADNSNSNSNTTINKPIALFINTTRLDYDYQLDFSKFNTIVDFRRNNIDNMKDSNEIIQLIDKHQPTILITKEMIIPSKVIKQLPNSVQLLCEAGTGYNNIPIQTAQDKGLIVCNIPTYSTDAVAHMAITYIMNFSIQMFQQQAMLQNGNKSNFTGPFTLPLMELTNKTLGLVGGSGLIGSKVADIAISLGMNIIISSRSGSLPNTHRLSNHENVQIVSNINDLLLHSDFVSLHTPLNDETRNTFGKRQIELMKSSAYLINTSRGGVINENELIDCLQRNVIAGAGLDVTCTEPPTMDSLLWTLDNVWLTPHIGWRRLETRQRLVNMTYENIKAFITAQSPQDYRNVVS